jgi:hypothetical protein
MAGIQRAEHPGELRRMTKKPNDSPEVGCGDERMTQAEEVAIALHKAVWNHTSSWEYENPKLKEHYCAMAEVAIKTVRLIDARPSEKTG